MEWRRKVMSAMRTMKMTMLRTVPSSFCTTVWEGFSTFERKARKK